MRRYEFSDGKSNKFWQIERQGSDLHIAWGKIGTGGQSQVKAFDDEAKAGAAMDKLVKEKTSKGYVLAGEAPMAASATPKTPARAATPGPAAKPKAAKSEPAAVPAPSAQSAAPADEAPPSVVAGDAASAPAAEPARPPMPAGADGWLAASVAGIDAALAARRAQPTFDEEALRVWPQVLQALADGEFENTSAKSFTPARAKRRFGLSDGAWQLVASWFLQAHLGSDYGYTSSFYLSANVQADAAKALARLAGGQAEAGLARMRAQCAAAWADVHGGEPAARAGDRFGQIGLQALEPLPSRSQPGEPPARKPFAEAWKALRKQGVFRFDPASVASEYAQGITQLNVRLSDARMPDARMPSADPVAPDALADQMLLTTAVHMYNHGGMRASPDDVIAGLVDTHGLPQLVRMLGRSLQSMVDFSSGANGWHLLPWRPDWATSRSDIHPGHGIWPVVRRHLAHADEALWRECVAAALETLPEVPVDWRPMFGPLFIESPEVIGALIAGLPARGALSPQSQWLLACTDDPAAVAALAGARDGGWHGLFGTPAMLDDMLLRFGARAIPALAQGALHEQAAERLMAINHPDALHALARVASTGKDAQARLKLAAARWPLAALAGIARACAGGGKDAGALLPLLREALIALGPIATLARPWLEPAAWNLVVQQAAKLAGPTDVATAGELPAVLAQPPWLQKRKPVAAARPLALDALELPAQEHWRPGEKEALRQADGLARRWTPPATAPVADKKAQGLAQDLAFQYRNPKIGYITQCADAIAAGDAAALIDAWETGLARARQGAYFDGWISATGIVALPEPLGLAFWNATAGEVSVYDPAAPMLQWGLAAVPGLARLLQNRPAEHMGLAIHFGDTRLAPAAARAAFKTKAARQAGLRWLRRWPEHAAAGLIAPALGKAGEARDVAAKALRLLASQGHAALLLQMAERYPDPAVRAGVQAILDENPLDLYPAKILPLPGFWQPAAWTRPLLPNGKALGDDALNALGQMLAFPRTEGLYAGIDAVRAACTPQSLADFSWDLFTAWLAAGAPSKENWAFTTLGLFGGDEAARRLTPLIRAWPGESAHARAVLGLDLLEQIGTDTALMLLNGIAQKVKFKGLQDKAREKIAAIAEARDLSPEELEDRLAPDLGLDAQGSLLLDFGPRQFKVGFDETLKPWVRDFTNGQPGARLKDLPKPTKADDEQKAKDATERYKALKKDARTIAAQQIQRLETAMCRQRRWTEANFRDFIATHPLVRHIAQRLVWGVYAVSRLNDSADSGIPQDEKTEAVFPSHGGQLLACFRLAEDGSCTNADDEPFTLPEAPEGQAIRIGVPHALQIAPEDAQAFGQLFADYELLQPFAQIGRDTYELTDDEKQGTELTRWKGVKVPTGKVMGLTGKGWERGAPQDGGWIGWMEWGSPAGCVVLDLDPGMAVGDINWEPEQTLGVLTRTRTAAWNDDHRLRWGDLDAISASELVRTMESLRP